MNILELIKEQRDFTNSEVHIAQYILEHMDEISSLSIRELADSTFTSNGTIIRLCRKLGTDGYKEFKIRLVKAVEKQHQEKANVNYNSPFSNHESPQSIMGLVSVMEKNAIDACYSSVSPEAVKKAADWIQAARNVYIVASGDTQAMVGAFSYMLQKIGIHPIMVNAYQDSVSIAYNMTSDDVALIASYSGSFLYYKGLVLLLKRSRCKTILITSRQDVNTVDLPLVFPALEDPYGRTAGYYSQTAIRYVLDCIYGAIFSSNLPQYTDMRKNADRLNEEVVTMQRNKPKVHP